MKNPASYLADGNVLVALVVREHRHHEAATTWFAETQPRLATCPITEGTLIRFLIRTGVGAGDAVAVLESIRAQPWHEFWSDSLPFAAATMAGVIGHRQVTDAYLAGLAREHGSRVVTLDRGLALLRPDQALLISTDA